MEGLAATGAVLAGLGLLAVGADRFVEGAAALAVRARLSAVVVGAVVIGLGTSLPEALVSTLAALEGSTAIAVGNVIGSNLANLTLVLGGASLVATTHARRRVVTTELPLAVLATALFALAIQQGLTRVEGVVLLAGLVAVLATIVGRRSDEQEDQQLVGELQTYEDIAQPTVDDTHQLAGQVEVRAAVGHTFAGLAGVILGAQTLVWGARGIAGLFGLSEGLVGLTLVAVGTSAPELATGISAARRGHGDLLVGNVLGSNTFNSLGVGGLVAITGPGPVEPALAGLANTAMLTATLAVTVLLIARRRVSRVPAGMLVAGWVGTIPLVS